MIICLELIACMTVVVAVPEVSKIDYDVAQLEVKKLRLMVLQ
jgi:hypothetical protein